MSPPQNATPVRDGLAGGPLASGVTQGLTSDRLEHLDMLRGVAALLVCIGHVRGLVLVDYDQVAGGSLALKAIYAMTALGHQAVIVFFALSGYLVGGQAARQILTGRWSAAPYAARRLARLWTVVIPALLLTWICDRVGMAYGGILAYAGAYYEIFASGPSPAQPADHGSWTLAGNVVFLQTIAVPVFGSNGPLWSLANEFWYYVAGPAAVAAMFGRVGLWQRFTAVVIFLAVILWLPAPIVWLGIIWAFGAAASFCSAMLGRARLALQLGLLAILVAALVIAIAFTRSDPGLLADILLGAIASALLPCLACMPAIKGWYGRVAHALSEISYTLYVVHYPIVFAVVAVALAPAQLQPTLSAMGVMLALAGLAIVSAVTLWWVFERNTPLVRRLIERPLASATARTRKGYGLT